MTTPVSKERGRSVGWSFDILRSIEAMLLGTVLFAASLVRTTFSFLSAPNFAIYSRVSPHNPDDEESNPLITYPLTFAVVMFILALFCIAIEGDAPEGFMFFMFNNTLKNLNKESLLGVLRAAAPLIANVLFMSSSMTVAHRLLRQPTSFQLQVNAASYAIGGFFAVGVIAFTLQSLEALYIFRWSHWTHSLFPILHWVRRGVQLLLLIWVMFCYVRIIKRLGCLSVSKAAFVSSLGLVIFLSLLQLLGLVSRGARQVYQKAQQEESARQKDDSWLKSIPRPDELEFLNPQAPHTPR